MTSHYNFVTCHINWKLFGYSKNEYTNDSSLFINNFIGLFFFKLQFTQFVSHTFAWCLRNKIFNDEDYIDFKFSFSCEEFFVVVILFCL